MDDIAWSRLLDDGACAARASDASLARALAPLAEAKQAGADYVVAQLGMSLDGRIATHTGSSRGINGPEAMRHLHRLRALVDGVVVGARTARIDDPRLTVRHCAGESPARVVIDPKGTVPPDAQVWSAADGVRRLVFGGAEGLDDDIERIPTPESELSPAWILDALKEHGIGRVLVEGGGKTVSQFLSAEAVDSLHLLIGPIVIGEGLVGLNLPGPSEIDAINRPETDVHRFAGGDVLFASRLRQD